MFVLSTPTFNSIAIMRNVATKNYQEEISVGFCCWKFAKLRNFLE